MIAYILTDSISESSPRVVDDNRARKLSNELRRCSYYETCATYGLNVDRVFQDGKFNVFFFFFYLHVQAFRFSLTSSQIDITIECMITKEVS